MNKKIEEIIKLLDLNKLDIEGGYFRETYRSAFKTNFTKSGSCATSIFYLITSNSFSTWHKIKSDEIWFFMDGYPAEQTLLLPDGNVEQRILGKNFSEQEILQSIVPANAWQSTKLKKTDKNAYALFSVVACPGFDYSDFTPGNIEELARTWPKAFIV